MNEKNHTAFLLALKRNIRQWLHQNNLAAAEGGLAELKQLDPLNLQTRGLELEYLLNAGHYQDAENLAAQLIQLFPASSRIHYLAGRVAYKQKNYDSALSALEESFRLYPHWRTERYIGKTCTQSGDFDRAESHLLNLSSEHPLCLLDLAWLYERKQQYSRARTMLEQYLQYKPEDAFAKQQQQRLQAHALPPEQIRDEVETLSDFNEVIPIGLHCEYVRNLLTQGKGKILRQWLSPRIDNIERKDALQLGWVCYKLKAYDLAYTLFIRDFEKQYDNFKYQTALELSAQKSGQLDQLINLYEQYTETDKRFYGRLKRLQKMDQ
jgi:tetratricopeptide (TPR) repeat protein